MIASFRVKRPIKKELVLGIILAVGLNGYAQTPSSPQKLTREQQEEFLRTARILRTRGLPGITNSLRATLTDGRLTHDAHIQTVDIRKAIFQGTRGTEINFSDSYKYNIAAYRLDRVLGMDMVPVSVERRVRGEMAAVTWWVDDVLMTEKQRYNRKIEVPEAKRFDWNKQMFSCRVFDQLIYNTDRNLGNLAITTDWQICPIDHTRAFRLHKKLLNPKNLVKCDRRLLTAMRKLDYQTLEGELRPFLNKAQIGALLARRDRIVEFFDQEIQEKGEQAVLFDLHDPR